jgi:hypothetical protein
VSAAAMCLLAPFIGSCVSRSITAQGLDPVAQVRSGTISGTINAEPSMRNHEAEPLVTGHFGHFLVF